MACTRGMGPGAASNLNFETNLRQSRLESRTSGSYTLRFITLCLASQIPRITGRIPCLRDPNSKGTSRRERNEIPEIPDGNLVLVWAHVFLLPVVLLDLEKICSIMLDPLMHVPLFNVKFSGFVQDLGYV